GSTVVIRLSAEGENALIKVIDNGPGIENDHLERIFQRFFRVPETRMAARGSGLGLYICRQIIVAHSGTIKAESVVGQGTTFHITMPIVLDDMSD
ncbi:MAG: ATP-binding protein, partial [Chloroflexi bacterium]|nr:ATP-binding protein [Chloroflexota bacterium]